MVIMFKYNKHVEIRPRERVGEEEEEENVGEMNTIDGKRRASSSIRSLALVKSFSE